MSMYYKVVIGNVEYGMNDIESVTIERPLFDRLSAGNACSAKLEITFWPIGAVPRMAEITPYARETEGDEWTQLGVFYTDERSSSESGKMTLVAYDAMLKGEVEWIPSDNLAFPMPMTEAIQLFASLMGLEIDDRTTLNEAYTEVIDEKTRYHYYIDYPANAYTPRDIMGYIGAAHCGNWTITAQNKLLLVPLFGSMPEE